MRELLHVQGGPSECFSSVGQVLPVPVYVLEQSESRAVLMDLEPGTMDSVRTGELGLRSNRS